MGLIVQRVWPTPSRGAIALQHSSVGLKVGDRSVYFPWISAVSYTMTMDPGESRGTSPFPTGVTLGEAKANASVTVNRLYREAFLDLIDPNKSGPFDKFFHLQVAYQEFGWASVEMDEFDARITEIGSDSSAGNSPLETKFSLYVPGLIIYNRRGPISGVYV